MINNIVESLLKVAVAQAQKKGEIPLSELPDIALEWPQNVEHGDYASSLPLKMARSAAMNPIKIAEIIRDNIPLSKEIESVVVAPPGFLNFKMDSEWMKSQLPEIISKGSKFGETNLGNGSSVQVEFVSVNPTGPVHVGHGRGAILGSTLSNILSFTGHKVQKEYYVNDAGNQIDNFSRSLWVRYMQALEFDEKMPAEGYLGNYMIALGEDIANQFKNEFTEKSDASIKSIGIIGMEWVLEKIKTDLLDVNVSFDNWFSEQSLFEEGTYETALELLKSNGHTIEREEALWFTGSLLGDTRDSVLIRSTGVPTYFASDIAYHHNKFLERKFDRVINVWGADHQGHVPRMKAIMTALDLNPEKLDFILVQLVTLRRGDTTVKVSKRTGDMITLAEVVEEVGADACRYFFLSRSPDSQMDFDLELAKQSAPENPVYYIQYAYARIASILRDFPVDKLKKETSPDLNLLKEKSEQNLIRQMLRFPEVLDSVAAQYEPHHLTHYTLGLASSFHDFYTNHRVIGVEEELSRARLTLIQATQIVLSNALTLMGMSTPEKM